MTPIERPQCPEPLLLYLADPDNMSNSHFFEFVDKAYGRLFGSTDRSGKHLRDYLSSVFKSRCCYCEIYADRSSSGVIDRFRPRGGSSGRAGPVGGIYFHLQADWRNLYWACATCNRYKADRFPLFNEPAPPSLSYDEIVSWEQPAVLDPCIDNPDDHLVFQTDGKVDGLTPRGDATITLFDLNRRQLVTARAEQVRLFGIASDQERKEKAAGNSAHCAVWRQMLYGSDRPRTPAHHIVDIDDLQVSRAEGRIDTEVGIGLEAYSAHAQYISRIRIKNYGPIHLLDLDLSMSQSPQAPCFALLGENGVGKSTVLRALAMALSGKAYAKSLGATSTKLLSDGAQRGEVRVSIVGSEHDIVMTLHRGRSIEFDADHSRSLVLAYGATRLLPRGRHKPKPGRGHANIDNLFDPFLPISNPQDWLASLDPHALDQFNEVLLDLMPQEHQIKVVKDADRDVLSLEIGGIGGRKVQELSDGYQSMLGMAADIMKVLSLPGAELGSAEGIVLIDELGNHFHPAWRLRCLTAMRKAFPRAQFIYSTHDPLCLRGLYGGEVAVLMRDRLGVIYALEDLPPVSKLRVEQLLSSEHFGLRTTADPQMEEDIREYEELLGTADRTQEEDERLSELVQILTDDRYLGATRRERLALQLLDSMGMDEVPAQPSVSAQELSSRTVSRLRHVMHLVSPRADIQAGSER
ncbi:AAA family ATPase [Pseudomonas syringae]|uniref:AAA family ATPase n=1 Tax=Pseudomonas syringae TaxID=317 RepID=UPI002A7558F3|nr:AAA family ATPase [Pseudomonas syringae]MDY2562302.1 AAA family ATPase [Pseudomonas syringae]